MSQQPSDFRDFIKAELERRVAKNPHYSQRAMARDLGVKPNRLSQILTGKLGISSEAAPKIAASLGLSASRRAVFLDLVLCRHSRSRVVREAAKKRLAKRHAEMELEYKDLPRDLFSSIWSWEHLAILELTKLKSFRGSANWISKYLRIPKADVEKAVNRLYRLGLLRFHRGAISLVKENYQVPDGAPSEQVRAFHSQILHLALHALAEQADEDRIFGTTIFAISKSKLPLVREKLDQLWKELDALLKDDEANELYCFSRQFFVLGGTE